MAAILWPWSTLRPSCWSTSSAKASPAEGPPTPCASIETADRQVDRLVRARVEVDRRRRRGCEPGLTRHGRERHDPPLAVAQDREAEASSRSACPAISAETPAGERTGFPSIATITSVGASLPPAGNPGSTSSTSAPCRARRHLLARARAARPRPRPAARSPSPRASTWFSCGARDARRDDLVGRVEVGAGVRARRRAARAASPCGRSRRRSRCRRRYRGLWPPATLTSGATGWARSGRKM